MRVAVLGAGPAGLAAAHHLAQRGIEVSVFEAEPRIGGLASSFDIGPAHVERYYHFLCLHDDDYLSTCAELGLADRVRWARVRMGHFYNGTRYNFGDPWDLLSFPHLTWGEKWRFATALLALKRRPFSDWLTVAGEPAGPWLARTFGERVFRIFHQTLLSGKFGEYRRSLSAAWMWARIHRVGKSRSRWLQREVYGYLEGGSWLLLQTLAEHVRARGGTVRLNAPVRGICLAGDRVAGVSGAAGDLGCDAVISTIPFQILRKILPDVAHPYFRRLDSAEYFGVTCLALRVRKRLTPHFWLNINDPRITIPGVIEFTNLNPLPVLGGDALLYVPQYLDPRDARFGMTRDEALRAYLPFLRLINPGFDESQVVESHFFKDTHAQPLCDIGFHERIPAIRTPVRGLYCTDSYQLHPHDRTVSSSLRLGREAASLLLDDLGRAA